MHDRWLDTTITPLEVIGVSTPQNNDACSATISRTQVHPQHQYEQPKSIYPQYDPEITAAGRQKPQGIPTYSTGTG